MVNYGLHNPANVGDEEATPDGDYDYNEFSSQDEEEDLDALLNEITFEQSSGVALSLQIPGMPPDKLLKIVPMTPGASSSSSSLPKRRSALEKTIHLRRRRDELRVKSEKLQQENTDLDKRLQGLKNREQYLRTLLANKGQWFPLLQQLQVPLERVRLQSFSVPLGNAGNPSLTSADSGSHSGDMSAVSQGASVCVYCSGHLSHSGTLLVCAQCQRQ